MIIPSNFFLQNTLNSLLQQLSTTVGVKLYTNPATPTPAWTVGQFTEAGFTGYAAKAWVDPPPPNTRKVTDGWYQTVPVSYIWTCTGGAPQVITGLYVTTGPILWFSQPLAEPFTISAGISLPVSVALSAIVQTLCTGTP